MSKGITPRNYPCSHTVNVIKCLAPKQLYQTTWCCTEVQLFWLEQNNLGKQGKKRLKKAKFPLKVKEEDPVNLLLQKSSLLLNLVKRRNIKIDTNKLENIENVQHQNESKVKKT